MKFLKKLFAFFVLTFIPSVVSAHEVYVLSPDAIQRDIAKPALNLYGIAMDHRDLFFVSTLLIIIGIAAVFGISISKRVEKMIDPFLLRLKKYTGHIAQVTFGSALFASAYFGALFGPELPLVSLFGFSAHTVATILFVVSLLILTGVYARLASLIAFVVFVFAVPHIGFYFISYLAYFGEALIIALFGASYSLAHVKPVVYRGFFLRYIQKRKYLFLRIAFSTSLIFAAVYAKFIHGSLALDTVNTYHLTDYFHFEPLFVVLGAFMVEMAIALFYLIGFEVRFTSVVFLVFLSMSLAFFGEVVWPHIILIGTALAMFAHGYDDYMIEKHWYKKGEKEPVL